MIPRFEDAVMASWIHIDSMRANELTVRFVATARVKVSDMIDIQDEACRYVHDQTVERLRREVAESACGTCKDVCSGIAEFICSSCGFRCDITSWETLFDGDDGRHRHHHHGTPNYCPNCGRKVVDE